VICRKFNKLEVEMAKEAALSQNTDLQNLTNMDFGRYQTDELRLSIEQILSITGNLAFFLRTLFIVWVMGPIIMPLLFPGSDTWIRVVWSLYGAFSFFFIALGLGIFFTKRRLLRNITSIVDIIFEVCAKVLDDLGHIRGRGVGVTAVSLVSKVDRSVIRPVVEGILRSKLGFFSRPLIYMYKNTIGSIIKVTENTLAQMAVEADQGIAEDNASRLESGEKSKDFIRRAEDATLRLKEFIQRVHEVSINTAHKITKFAIIPSFLLALAIFFVAILPALLTKM
jgi:hypothetical protein